MNVYSQSIVGQNRGPRTPKSPSRGLAKGLYQPPPNNNASVLSTLNHDRTGIDIVHLVWLMRSFYELFRAPPAIVAILWFYMGEGVPM